MCGGVFGDAAGGCHYFDGGRRRPEDADGVGWSGFRSMNQDGVQQLGEQMRPQTVGAELEIVALFCRGTGWREHDAGIVDQNVQTRLTRAESFD